MPFQPIPVLCPEDRPEFHKIIVDALTSPTSPVRDKNNNELRFAPKIVETSAEAEEELLRAQAEHRPWPVMLLDFQLPYFPGGEPSMKEGKALLELVRSDASNSCDAVVVQTVEEDFDSVREAIRGGVADFLRKPFKKSEVYYAVATAYLRSREQLAVSWDEIQHSKRLQWIVFQACNQVADGLMKTVVGEMGIVLEKAAAISKTVESEFRFDFNRDRDEPICRSILELDRATRGVTASCSKQRPVRHQRANLESFSLDELVHDSLVWLTPGLSYQRIVLETKLPETVIVAFRDEIEAIVRELLFNAIEASEPGARVRVHVTPANEGFVELMIEDEGLPLNGEAIGLVDFSTSYDRTWSLSLAMQVVESLGGQLSVVPCETGGNRVVARLRSERHVQSPR